MLDKSVSPEEIEEQFVTVANALYAQFPDLDLRFNLKTGSNKAKCLIPNSNKTAIKLHLGHKNLNLLVRDAVWAIKVLTRRFDD